VKNSDAVTKTHKYHGGFRGGHHFEIEIATMTGDGWGGGALPLHHC